MTAAYGRDVLDQTVDRRIAIPIALVETASAGLAARSAFRANPMYGLSAREVECVQANATFAPKAAELMRRHYQRKRIGRVVPIKDFDELLPTGGGASPDFFVAPDGTVSVARPRPTHANAHGHTVREVNLVSGRNNCASCSVATDRLLAGAANEFADLSGVTSTRTLELFYRRNFVTALSREQLESLLSTYGTRGIVFGSRGPGKVGHFFNGVNQKGAIRFLDGQSGTSADLSCFTEFWFLPTN